MRGNKRYYRIVASLMLTVLLLSLCGCDSSTSSNGKNKVYTSAQSEFDFLVDAITRQDKAGIYAAIRLIPQICIHMM